jgi:hypothetical protein
MDRLLGDKTNGVKNGALDTPVDVDLFINNKVRSDREARRRLLDAFCLLMKSDFTVCKGVVEGDV